MAEVRETASGEAVFDVDAVVALLRESRGAGAGGEAPLAALVAAVTPFVRAFVHDVGEGAPHTALVRFFHPSRWFSEPVERRATEANLLRVFISYALARASSLPLVVRNIASMRMARPLASGIAVWVLDGELTMRQVFLLSEHAADVRRSHGEEHSARSQLTPPPCLSRPSVAPSQRTQALRLLRDRCGIAMSQAHGNAAVLAKYEALRRKYDALRRPDFWLALTVVLSARTPGQVDDDSIGTLLATAFWSDTLRVPISAAPLRTLRHGWNCSTVTLDAYRLRVNRIVHDRPCVLKFRSAGGLWSSVRLTDVLLAQATYDAVFATIPPPAPSPKDALMRLIRRIHGQAAHFRGVSYSRSGADRFVQRGGAAQTGRFLPL